MNNKNPIVKGAIISYVSIFLNIAITFFYTPWMIRKIGVSDYGLYTLIISFISYFILDFGLSSAIQRFIAKYRAEGDEQKVSNMIGITTRVYLYIDMAILLVLIVLYFFIANIFTGLTPAEIEKLKVLYIIAGTFSALSFMLKPVDGAMLAYEFFVENKALDMASRVGTVLLVCIALLFNADVFALVLINGVVAFLVSLIKFFVFKRKSQICINWGYFNKNELKDITSFSTWTFGMSLAQRMRLTLIPSVLGIVSNSHEIAVFSLGMSLEGMVFTLSYALNGLFLPKVTRMVVNGDKEGITNLMIRVGRLQLYLFGLVFSGFCIFGQNFLNLWVGDEFNNTFLVTVFILAPSLISLTQQIANDLVYAENKVRYTASLTFSCAVVGLIIAFILSSSLGAIGAAIGTGVGLCLFQVLVNIFYHRKINLDIPVFFRECHGKILPLQTIFAVFFYLLYRQINAVGWLGLFGGIATYCIFFLTISYIFLFNSEEKELISIRKKIKKSN